MKIKNKPLDKKGKLVLKLIAVIFCCAICLVCISGVRGMVKIYNISYNDLTTVNISNYEIKRIEIGDGDYKISIEGNDNRKYYINNALVSNFKFKNINNVLNFSKPLTLYIIKDDYLSLKNPVQVYGVIQEETIIMDVNHSLKDNQDNNLFGIIALSCFIVVAMIGLILAIKIISGLDENN